MRTIELAHAFKRDYKRIKANPRHQDIAALFEALAMLLAEDLPLPASFRDHTLGGNWHGYRECHLKPDLLVIYSTRKPEILRFSRIGSHAELFR